MTGIPIDRLDARAIANAGVIWISGADEVLRASALRAVEVMAPSEVKRRRLVAEDLAGMTATALDALSPNGLFGADEVTIVDRIAASHRAKLPDWCALLAADGLKPSLILCGAAMKSPPSWPAPLRGPLLEVTADISATPADALRRIAARYFGDAPVEPLKPVARRMHTLALERALQLLALDDRSIDDAAKTLDSTGSDPGTAVRSVLSGDLPGLAQAFADEIRTIADLSGVLAQLAWPVRRAQSGDRLAASLLDIHRAERAIREQAPLATLRAERSLLRIARRAGSQRR